MAEPEEYIEQLKETIEMKNKIIESLQMQIKEREQQLFLCRELLTDAEEELRDK